MLPRFSKIILIVCLASVSLAEDFKTISGKEYKNATVSRVEPDGIVVRFSGGIVKIPFTDMSDELRLKYNYDPDAAKQYTTEIQQKVIEQNQMIAREASPI